MALKQGRSKRILGLFKNEEIDFQFMRTLSAMSEGGAAVGECLIVRDATKDAKSNAQAWFELAEKLEKSGEEAESKGYHRTAKFHFLRATNYYRASLNIFSPIANEDEHHQAWQKATELFERVGQMFEQPMQRIDVPFEDGILPCYLLQPNNNKKNRPTLMSFTGGEGSAMEMYFWIGAEGVRRGYNILLCDVPGNLGAMYRNNKKFTLRADTEKPIGTIIDKLVTLPEVDPERIGAIGFSYGGYFVSRAAVFDKRIAALIPDTPLHNAYELFSALIPTWLLNNKRTLKLAEFLSGKLLKLSNPATLELVLWLTGSSNPSAFFEFARQSNIIDKDHEITCPVLGLYGESEGSLFEKQAKDFYENIGSTNKQLHKFTLSEGGGAHCQVDNYNQLQEVVYDWLDDVFNYGKKREKTSE
ncbi:MAG TPA: alpha/beta hydrolase [Methanobacteriaceae archaeon]|nr:alpha/beta hydrolase [Methanobacteriaceae archaeon]